MTLYECTECTELYDLPVKQTDGGVLRKECDECGAETLTDVSDLCEHGRTFMATRDADPCYNDATDEWDADAETERYAETHRICDEHDPETMWC